VPEEPRPRRRIYPRGLRRHTRRRGARAGQRRGAGPADGRQRLRRPGVLLRKQVFGHRSSARPRGRCRSQGEFGRRRSRDSRGRTHEGPTALCRASVGQAAEVPCTSRPRGGKVGRPRVSPVAGVAIPLVLVSQAHLFGPFSRFSGVREVRTSGLLVWPGLPWIGTPRPTLDRTSPQGWACASGTPPSRPIPPGSSGTPHPGCSCRSSFPVCNHRTA
jgi:hypothetical protein